MIRVLALVSLFAMACGDDSPGGQFFTSRVDRKVVPFAPDGVPCWDAPLLDEAPDTPGLQPACTATYLLPDGTNELLPMCGGGDALCWRFVEDAQACATTSLSLQIETSGQEFQAGATATIECLLAE